MRMLSKTLASGPEGSWRIVFNRDELHIYIGFAENDAVPVDGMTVEDFLTTVPRNSLHRETHGQLVQLLREWLA